MPLRNMTMKVVSMAMSTGCVPSEEEPLSQTEQDHPAEMHVSVITIIQSGVEARTIGESCISSWRV